MNPIIIFCAKYLIFVIGVIAFIDWLTVSNKKKLQVGIITAITGVIAFLLAKVSEAFFYDARPFVSEHLVPLFSYTADNGFPSDHTLLAGVIAVAVYSVSKKLGLGLLFLAIIIGIARVLAHVHHPIDIIGSLVFAGISGIVAYYLLPKIMEKMSNSQ